MIGGLKQIGSNKARAFDVHGLKESEVGKQNVPKYNVSVDTDDGSVWLTPVRPGSAENIRTPCNSLKEAMSAFPPEE
jgi:hypothetical protein